MAGESPEILQIEVGLLQNFAGVICCPDTGLAALVDPAFEVDRLYRLLAERGCRVGAVLLTHTHPDHVDGVPMVLAESGAHTPVHVGAAEADDVRDLCLREGFTPSLVRLQGGEVISLGNVRIHALSTPGHTRAGISYHLPDPGAVFTGDTLFVGTCGRTNFPGSDAATLYRSLITLAGLPEETRIYPGHDYGPTRTSTLAWELRHNRCLRHESEAAFVRWRR